MAGFLLECPAGFVGIRNCNRQLVAGAVFDGAISGMTGGMASAFGGHGAVVVPIARSVLRGESRRVTAAICPLAALAAGRNVRRGLETVPT